MAAAIGVEAARQTVLRDHLVQRAQGRVRALFGDQKSRVDLAGGIVQRHDQVERRLAIHPFVPRPVPHFREGRLWCSIMPRSGRRGRLRRCAQRRGAAARRPWPCRNVLVQV